MIECLCYFSVVVIKHLDQGNLQKKWLIWGFLFLRAMSHHGGLEVEAAGGWSKSWELTS